MNVGGVQNCQPFSVCIFQQLFQHLASWSSSVQSYPIDTLTKVQLLDAVFFIFIFLKTLFSWLSLHTCWRIGLIFSQLTRKSSGPSSFVELSIDDAVQKSKVRHKIFKFHLKSVFQGLSHPATPISGSGRKDGWGVLIFAESIHGNKRVGIRWPSAHARLS